MIWTDLNKNKYVLWSIVRHSYTRIMLIIWNNIKKMSKHDLDMGKVFCCIVQWPDKSLEKIFEIVQENTLKCSKLISFLGNKFFCFVASMGDVSILKSGWNMNKSFCCPVLDFFIVYLYLKQWGYREKKLQNATNS